MTSEDETVESFEEIEQRVWGWFEGYAMDQPSDIDVVKLITMKLMQWSVNRRQNNDVLALSDMEQIRDLASKMMHS